MYEGQPKGFPFGNFNVEDVMLPEGDDMGIPSEDEAEEEQEIQSESGFGNVICASVVGGVGGLMRSMGGGMEAWGRRHFCSRMEPSMTSPNFTSSINRRQS